MYKYIIKRLLLIIPIVLGMVLLIMFIMHITPGDVTTSILGSEWTEASSEALRTKLGLNRPFFVQYLDYVKNLFTGNFGISYVTGAPVMEQIAVRIPNTIYLTLGGMFVCLVFSIPIGVRAAIKPNSIFSMITTALALIGIAMPTFWLGLLLILLFAVNLGWFDVTGLNRFSSIVLPSITLGTSYMASIMRMTRSSMVESLRADYIRTARAKGVSERNVVYKHALHNSLLPTISVVGTYVGELIGGAVVTETVFSIPGMGRLMIESIQRRDTPCVIAAVVIMAVGIAVVSLLVDIIYAFVDPRIRSQYLTRRDKA